VGLAFFFTRTMIGYISLGLRWVNLNGGDNEIISLGFANVYRGTYVKEVSDEWLVSLTSPSHQGVSKGFGVPLWLVLVSVLGTGVYTISIIVRNIKDRVDFKDVQKVRDRIEDIVRHQFYILFSPLCAALVYQLLVTAGAANEHVDRYPGRARRRSDFERHTGQGGEYGPGSSLEVGQSPMIGFRSCRDQ
jgi:hypothetical protein